MISILGQHISLVRPEKIHQPQKSNAIKAKYNRRSRRVKLSEEEIKKIVSEWKGVKFPKVHSWD